MAECQERQEEGVASGSHHGGGALLMADVGGSLFFVRHRWQPAVMIDHESANTHPPAAVSTFRFQQRLLGLFGTLGSGRTAISTSRTVSSMECKPSEHMQPPLLLAFCCPVIDALDRLLSFFLIIPSEATDNAVDAVGAAAMTSKALSARELEWAGNSPALEQAHAK